MTLRAVLMKIVQQDQLNVLLTNGFPRREVSRLMGWFSRIEQPLVRAVSLRVWRFFSDVDLRDAQETRFRSLHDGFTRRLTPGARPVDSRAEILVSPCDAIVGACGAVTDGQVLQVKGLPYALDDLLGDAAHAAVFRDGCYVTLRLTAGMYHRFHAPHDCRVVSVTHVFGDAWNVNPPTLRRVKRVFCRNERALLRIVLAGSGHPVTLVPVAAVLVAGIRLGFLDLAAGRGSAVRREFACNVTLDKGAEMGWFEHGSTILVFAPRGFVLCPDVADGKTMRAGQPLMRLPA